MNMLASWLQGFIDPARLAASALGATVVTVLGEVRGLPEATSRLIIALMIVMTLDFICGASIALRDNTFTWQGLLKGLAKFFTYGAVILVGVSVDMALPSVVPMLKGPLLVSWVLAFLVVCDSLSALNHLAVLGAPMPEGLRKLLMKLKKQLDACPAEEK